MYNFVKNFTVLNLECFYYCIVTLPAVCVCARARVLNDYKV